jgi:hypothetical protein
MSLLTRNFQRLFLKSKNEGINATSKALFRVLIVSKLPFSVKPSIFRKHIGKKIGAEAGWVVQYGHFKGLLLRPDFKWGKYDLASMILGLYESQVVSELMKLSAEKETLIDIGSADGFYAAGLLKFSSIKNAFLFEMDKESQASTEKTILLNNIGKDFTIFGKANLNSIEVLLGKNVDFNKSLILCDIEGAELELFTGLDPQIFAQATLMIETHIKEYGHFGLDKLYGYFQETHNLTWLTAGPRNLDGIKELSLLNDDSRWLICSEGREFPGLWLVCKPQIQVDSPYER